MRTVGPRQRGPTAHAPAEGLPAAGRGAYPWRPVLGAFTVVATLLTVVVGLASRTVPRPVPFLQGPAWLDGWFQYDSGWYHRIATQGYEYVPGEQSSIAFFPTYPLTVRGLGGVIGDHQVAGSLVALLAGGAAAVLFGAWVWRRLPRPAALTAIALLLLYPYALFLYGAMYADSLFLLNAVGAFLLLERRQYWLAGLVGALATAGRPVGVAVAVGLVVRTLELLAQDRAARAAASADADADAGQPVRPGWLDVVRAVTAVRWREAGVLLSAAGLAAWAAFLWVAFGDPLAFVAVESAPGWDQGVGPRTWFKVSYVQGLLEGPFTNGRLLTVQAILCVLAVLLLRRVWRRFGWGYAAYAAVVLAIPIIGTDDFMGTGRYVLVAFPVIAAAGDLLASTDRRWVRPAVLVGCGLLLVGMTALYARGIQVS
ncbi:MAG: putative lipoprotein [Actinotalea sp.]|nr:putative lipoprotein [Actinotalea sp.]